MLNVCLGGRSDVAKISCVLLLWTGARSPKLTEPQREEAPEQLSNQLGEMVLHQRPESSCSLTVRRLSRSRDILEGRRSARMGRLDERALIARRNKGAR
jgi:hypothetical protein